MSKYLTMNRKKKSSIIMLCLLGWVTQLFAQNTDLTTWTKIGVTYELNPKWAVLSNMEWRTKDHLHKSDRLGLDVGCTYEALPFMKIGGGYELHYRDRDEEGWRFRHRYHFDGTFSTKLSKVKFSLRERYQHTFGQNTKEFRLRSRLNIDYEVYKQRIIPYVSVEMYNGLGRKEHFDITRMRYRGGLSISLSNNCNTELFYIFQTETNTKKHIVGLTWVYKLNNII